MSRYKKAAGKISDFCTVMETAKRWKVSKQRVHQWIDDGRVEAFTSWGQELLIKKSAKKPKRLTRGQLTELMRT